MFFYNEDNAEVSSGLPVEQIVTDGLQLHLDAGDPASYPGTGTTWTDLTGNGGTSVLSTTVQYSSENNGYLIFDTTTENADFFAPNLAGTATVEIWARVKSNTSSGMLFGFNKYDILLTNAPEFGFNSGAGDLYGIASNNFFDTWTHFVFEMRSDVSYTNNKMYIDGIQQTLSKIRPNNEMAAYRNFNNGHGRISGWRASNDKGVFQDVAIFRIYNRSLAEHEVLQNFNATKDRFGL